MTTILTTRRASCAVVAIIAFLAAAYVLAQGFSGNFLAQGRLDHFSLNNNGAANMDIAKRLLVPGEATPWFSRTGPTYFIVAGGRLTEDRGCGNLTEYPTSTATAFETPAEIVHRYINQGGQATTFYVVRFTPDGVPPVRPADPPICP